ncbi:MAG: glycerophosphodiester phosphodiesterase family protein [Motiliproteus sp.]
MPAFELIGHRGYPARYPENTLLGFEQAIDAGARYIEADVQLSADAVPFVFHDRTLTRLCGVDGSIHQLSAEQLRRCSPFSPQAFGNRFRHIPMLQLDQLVALLQRQPQVTLFLELKRGMMQTLAPALAVAKVLECIGPVRSQVVLISFSIKLLQQAQQQGWARLAPVLTRWYQLQQRATLSLEPEWVFLNHLKIPLGLGYDAAEPKLAVYEVSNIRDAQALTERGIRWIETDAIGEMLLARDALSIS